MKKISIILVMFILLTGCEKTVTCKGTLTQEDTKVNVEVKAKLENELINKANVKITFENETKSQSMCGMLSLMNSYVETDDDKIQYECNGKTIKLDNYLQLIDEQEKKDSYTKDEFIKLMKNQQLTCK